jgi:nicotinamidase-related amidase
MSKKPYVRLDKDNAAVLLVDHQTGLLSLVRDIDPDKFKNNVLALADMAEYFKLPTILTTSFETGPNGPLVPELKENSPPPLYRPPRPDQCLGQRGLRQGRQGHGQEAAHRRRRGDRGLRGLPGAVGPG